jgi:hypothetical protein
VKGRAGLLGEALEYSSKDLTRTDLVDWLAVLIGVHAPSHCLTRLTADQTESKLVVAFTSDKSRTLEVRHDNVDR